MALTARQQAFVDAYSGNAAEAARAAGYGAPETAGPRLLRNVQIAAAIRSRQNAEAAPRIATRQQRQAFWSQVMADTGEEMAARLKASELLGKSEADFTDKLSHEGNVNIIVGHPYEGEK